MTAPRHDGNQGIDYRGSILPRSLQRPVAVVEGSLTKNLNKIGVRLWTVAT
jgi:hypothetical protein